MSVCLAHAHRAIKLSHLPTLSVCPEGKSNENDGMTAWLRRLGLDG
jgi:hypothetical protein